jgi:hypothetical protein
MPVQWKDDDDYLRQLWAEERVEKYYQERDKEFRKPHDMPDTWPGCAPKVTWDHYRRLRDRYQFCRAAAWILGASLIFILFTDR